MREVEEETESTASSASTYLYHGPLLPQERNMASQAHMVVRYAQQCPEGLTPQREEEISKAAGWQIESSAVHQGLISVDYGSFSRGKGLKVKLF